MLGEFEQIAQIMAPLASRAKGAFALKNDAAVFETPSGYQSVVTTDTLIAGVHFLENDSPEDIAAKLMGVNLSDLASMGAKPVYYTLNASYPSNITIDWIKRFAGELALLQDQFQISLLGGDTTKTPGPLTLSLTAFGLIKKDKSLARTTACIGDLICTSGTIGDSALGLKCALGHLKHIDTLVERYNRPQPRVHLGQSLIGIATACLDISDGLCADLQHLEKGCEIYQENIPLSTAASELIHQDSSLWLDVLTGGDDYELLFTIPFERKEHLDTLSTELDLKLSVIGRITDKKGISVIDKNGQILELSQKGYRHF